MKLRLIVFTICLTIIGIGIANLVPAFADVTNVVEQSGTNTTTPVPVEVKPIQEEAQTNSNPQPTGNVITQNNPAPTQSTENSVPSTQNQPNQTVNPCQQ